MKKTLLLLVICMLCAGRLLAQTTYTIADDGFKFSPDSITIHAGDSVIFTGNDFHPVLEVSKSTWDNNGVTALASGFSFPNGNGKLKFAEAGTHYYVCTAHVASHQMKGRIFVSSSTLVPDHIGSLIGGVYPVPLTGNVLHISLMKEEQSRVSVSVFDLAGKEIMTSGPATVHGEYALDCSALPAGTYLLKVSVGEKSDLIKFIRQ